MKREKLNTIILFLTTVILIGVTACSSRVETPLTGEDFTIVYPAKNPNDISAKITLFRKFDKKTKEQIGVGTVFFLREKANIRASIDIENQITYGDQELMFHIDWINAEGKSIYLKRIDLAADDTNSTFSSSISISPEIREEGTYTIQLFFFRELIAEKKFEILPQVQIDPFDDNGISANITLYRKKSKKTGKLIGEGDIFKIKEKAKVRALIELENRFAYGNQELVFRYDWLGPDGESFYGKQIDFFPNDSTSIIKSSISIPPGKREPGKYCFRLYLYDELIAEKEFKLQKNK